MSFLLCTPDFLKTITVWIIWALLSVSARCRSSDWLFLDVCSITAVFGIYTYQVFLFTLYKIVKMSQLISSDHTNGFWLLRHYYRQTSLNCRTIKTDAYLTSPGHILWKDLSVISMQEAAIYVS